MIKITRRPGHLDPTQDDQDDQDDEQDDQAGKVTYMTVHISGSSFAAQWNIGNCSGFYVAALMVLKIHFLSGLGFRA